MCFDKLPLYPTPEKILIKETDGDIRVPYERIKSYDDKEFELFIREWVVSLKDRFQVRGFGGAGDKGRDVVAKDERGSYFYYQCKHYNHSLLPSDMMPEFGKLVYYTFVKDIPLPKEYYILAPQDINVKLNDLLNNPNEINIKLINEWSKTCRTRIKAAPVDLTLDLKKYIDKFDFRIIKTKTMLEVVEDHKTTAFYAFRFGGGLTITRDRSIDVPNIVEKCEAIYIEKYLDAISEKEGKKINSVEELLSCYPKYIDRLKVQRERFYSAENLKIFALQNLLHNEYFEDLANDIYYGIYDYLDKDYTNGYERLLDVMAQVAKIDLRQNLLSKYDLVHPQDRQGICHQLANERRNIVWTSIK